MAKNAYTAWVCVSQIETAAICSQNETLAFCDGENKIAGQQFFTPPLRVGTILA
jgi:hypothetical protein